MQPTPDTFPNSALEALCLRMVPEHPQADERDRYFTNRRRQLVLLALLLTEEAPHDLLAAALKSTNPIIRRQLEILLEAMDEFLRRQKD